MTPTADGTQDTSLIADLADELSDVRRRGIDRVDRVAPKQRRLELPVLEEHVDASPWRGSSRPVALRRLLASAVRYIDDDMLASAIAALYGLDTRAPVHSTEVEAYRLLGVPRNASAGTIQHKIRDARFELARAIRRDRRSDYRGPDGGRDTSPGEPPIPASVQAALDELLLLRSGRGISPQRVEHEALMIRALPGTRHELARRADPTRVGEAAVAFLNCAASDPRMYPAHGRFLVVASLNLSSLALPYEERIASWMAKYEVVESASFEEREAEALERFARVICSLDASPCADEDKRAKALQAARQMHGTYRLFYEAYGEEARDFLYYMIQEDMVSVGPSALSGRSGVVHLFDGLLGDLEMSLSAWTTQYRRRFAVNIPLVAPPLVRTFLADTMKARSPQQAEDVFEAMALRYRDMLPEHMQDGARKLSAEVPRTRRIEQRALDLTLGVLAQMAAHIETTGGWDDAFDLQLRDIAFMPLLPLVPVSELHGDNALTAGTQLTDD